MASAEWVLKVSEGIYICEDERSGTDGFVNGPLKDALRYNVKEAAVDYAAHLALLGFNITVVPESGEVDVPMAPQKTVDQEEPEEQERPHKLPKNRSLATLLAHNFETVPLNEEWAKVLGEPEINFVMFISGPSGGGKTTFALKLAKYLSTLRKVYYNSVEQGFSKSFADQVRRAGISADAESRFMIGSKDELDVMTEKIDRGRPGFVIIDSLQYIKMSSAQLQALTKRFRRMAFIVISWEKGGRPVGEAAQAIEFISDIKCRVQSGVAKCRSRYGATVPYTVFTGNRTAKNGQLVLEYETDRERLAAAKEALQESEPPT